MNYCELDKDVCLYATRNFKRIYGQHICFKNQIGEYHNEKGPAVIFESGSQIYYINDKIHREDGPAIIDLLEDNKRYFLYGNEIY